MTTEQKAKNARKRVLEMIYDAQTSHIGSNLSCMDILAVLFDKMNPVRDEFVCSKGWVAAGVYYFLADKGLIPKEDLERYCKPGEEKYIGLVEPQGQFGLRFAGGSMCMGLAAGVGFAKSRKLQKTGGRVYVLESDGGMNGGITWEAIMLAAQHDLSNLVLIVDMNGFQAMGKTNDILQMDGLLNTMYLKIRSFGWTVINCDGHNHEQLAKALDTTPKHRPVCILARTTKGKGVTFMENENIWHYKAPEKDEYEKALAELS